MLRPRLLAIVVGIGLIGGGGFIAGRPLWDMGHRSQAQAQADHAWKTPAAAVPVPDNAAGAGAAPAALKGAQADSGAPCSAGGDVTSAFALVTFPSLAKYGYAGVSGDGNWDLLHNRTMVHWHDSPQPGGQGNLILAFHREPSYEHIDELKEGDTVSLQDRSCQTWTYRITKAVNLSPDAATPLLAPTGGHEITMVTCTPFWIDSNRLVWRGELVSKDGKAITT